MVAAVIAIGLVVGASCAGCAIPSCGGSPNGQEVPGVNGEMTDQQIVDWSDEITERDIMTARQLGAPDDIITSLESGEWPSYRSKENVRIAEAAEDHLSERYDVKFVAFSVTLEKGFLRGPDSVALRVASGPFAGGTCACEFYPGGAPTDGKVNGGDPSWADNYIYVRLHGEYEEKVTEAAQSAFGDLPEGSWVCDVEMNDWTYREVQRDALGSGEMITLDPNASLTEAGPYLNGHVWVYLSPDSTLDDKECERRAEALDANLGGLGIRVSWGVYRVTKPLEGEEFTTEWAMAACKSGGFDWSMDGGATGVSQDVA